MRNDEHLFTLFMFGFGSRHNGVSIQSTLEHLCNDRSLILPKMIQHREQIDVRYRVTGYKYHVEFNAENI